MLRFFHLINKKKYQAVCFTDIVEKSEYFDEKWYLKQYPAVKKSKLSAAKHYALSGWKEGKNPGKNFDTKGYLDLNPDVKKANINPLIHYEKYGKKENREYTNGFLNIKSTHLPAYPETAKSAYYKKVTSYKKGVTCIFAMYNAQGLIPAQTIYYLKALKKIADNILVISDNPLILSELKKIKNIICYGCFLRHGEYDFGSYKKGIEVLKKNNLLEKTEQLILCNDSCFGPLYPLKNMYQTMCAKNVDFWGITQNEEFGRHIQSYFMCFNKKILNNLYFLKFFSGVTKESSQHNVVLNYEVPFTAYLVQHGFSFDTYIPYPSKNIWPRNLSNNITRTAAYLLDYKSPLIKIKYFSVSGWNRDSRKETLTRIRQINPDVYRLIKKCFPSANQEEKTENILPPRHLMCHIVNINDLPNNKISLFIRCNVNASGINLCLNGKRTEKNKNLTPIMQATLDALDKRYAFVIIDKKDLNPNKNKITAVYKEQIDLRRLARQNIFIRAEKNVVFIENKTRFFADIMLSHNYTLFQKALFLLCLCAKKKSTLFTELPHLSNDNSFQVFSQYRFMKKNVYYLIGQEHKNFIPTHNRKEIIYIGSFRHLWHLIHAKTLYCSYSVFQFLHPQLSDIHYAVLDYRLIYNWHGISCDDKNSLINRYIYGEPDLCFCCSMYEKQFFTEKCEYPAVVVTGNPRMDKWVVQKIDKNKIFLFFTWRRNIKSYYDFITSDYWQEIKNILTFISQPQYKNYKIYFCVYHHFYNLYKKYIIETVQQINPSVMIITDYENEKFNNLFATSKYLITDYSSVLYDHSYNKNTMTICYLTDKFTFGHFVVNKNFYERHLGTIVTDLNQLKQAMKKTQNTPEENDRRKKFYSYFDGRNTERVCAYLKNLENIKNN